MLDDLLITEQVWCELLMTTCASRIKASWA